MVVVVVFLFVFYIRHISERTFWSTKMMGSERGYSKIFS